MRGFSLIIPVHNEEPTLRANVTAMDSYLSSLGGLDYEILLACNGCTDASERIAAALAAGNGRIRHLSLESRGLGNAIREAAARARHDTLMFYAVDLPFGLDVIGESLEASAAAGGAVVVGSKGHPDSVVERSLARQAFSGIISLLNNLFFGLSVKDTQGSILFFREPLLKYAAQMDSPGAFFQAQILIYSKLSGCKLVEIPVKLAREVRKTRFSLAKDGLNYIRAILAEKRKLARLGE